MKWTCAKCRSKWDGRRKRCTCGRAQPKRRPSHKDVLAELPYEQWVIRFGRTCNICGASPKPGKKLMRDHWHHGPRAGQPRGVLCWKCNKYLHSWMESGWLLHAAAYVDGGGG